MHCGGFSIPQKKYKTKISLQEDSHEEVDSQTSYLQSGLKKNNKN